MRQDAMKRLGGSGIKVSPMGMGCWAIGGPFKVGQWDTKIPFQNAENAPLGWGDVNDNESISAIHAAIYHGVTFFDTADIYGTGHSEELLGKALVGRRNEVIIATKFGLEYNAKTQEWIGMNGHPEYVRQALEKSLQRLNTDYIDLYQFHVGTYPLSDARATRDVLEQLVDEGKIRTYGWSTDDVDCAKVFTEGPNCSTIQQELNVMTGNIDLLDLCEDSDMASIARSPLAMGLLTGKFNQSTIFPENDVRHNNMTVWKWFTKDGHPKKEYLDKLDKMHNVLRSNGRTLAQGAISFLWGLSPIVIPIPGFRSVQQVEENCKAMVYGPLTENEVMDLEILAGHKHHDVHHH